MSKYLSVLWGTFLLLIVSNPAYAVLAVGEGVNELGENVVNSVSTVPFLIGGACYILGLIFVINGILKLKGYVENEQQTPIRTPVIRLLTAGGLFALPYVLDVIKTTVDGGTAADFYPDNGMVGEISGVLATASAWLAAGTNISGILDNIGAYINNIPAVVAALSYLLALLLTVSAVIKVKEHVEEPEKTTLKEPVIRALVAGALIALPNVFEAIYTTVAGSGMGAWATTVAAWNATGFLFSSQDEGSAPCAAAMIPLLGGNSLGSVVCQSWLSAAALPAFLTGLSYLLGIGFGVWGIMKIRDHVLSPTQTKLSEGITRLVAGGAFFAMPVVATAVQSSVTPITMAAAAALPNMGFSGALTCDVTNSLDEAMGCFMGDMLGPMQLALNFFSFAAGLILVMIGISRLVKSAQDGPRGPGGMGTIATFIAGGFLMTGTSMIVAMSSSLFGSTVTATIATLTYTEGMSAEETVAAYNVISAVLKFMIVVGLLSFTRGIFIMRDAAEGKQQASVMSGMTHIIGGALAVNLGPLINAVQTSLGITAWGIQFGL